MDGTRTHAYLFRGPQVVGVLDADGRLMQRFVYATRGHVPDAMVLLDPDGTRHWYRLETDPLGSIRLVVDTETGQVVQRLEYDLWGRVLEDTSPGFQPFSFAGGLYDPDTGLVRFGARDYDPEVGRWTAKDPILFAGGDPNLYGYVLGDPVNWVDPSGLIPFDEIWDFANVAYDIITGDWEALPWDLAGLALPYIPAGLGKAKKLEKFEGLCTKLDDLVEAARKKYPRKAGKIENHHIFPKYLGGDPKGPTVPIDAAYHQEITNAFREMRGYGQERPSQEAAQEIMRRVYEKYPLPE